MDKNHDKILKKVKDYLDAPLTEDEISANNYRYHPAKTWFMKDINDLTNDKETILAIRDLLEDENTKTSEIYVKKFGWGGESPWSGRVNDSVFMSQRKNALGVKIQKIYDCKENLKLPGLINSIQYLFNQKFTSNHFFIIVGFIILLYIYFIYIDSPFETDDDEWFCQYEDPINKKGKICYRDSNGDGIYDEEW